MKVTRGICRLLSLFAAAFLVSSCLDSREEIWINADASGAARITVSLPASAALLHGGEKGVRKTIETYLEASPAFSSYALDMKTEAGRLIINVALTFDDALALSDLGSSPAAAALPSAGTGLLGKTEVQFTGLSVAFDRSVDLSTALPGAIFVPESQLAGHELTTILHLPLPATTHDATSTSDDGRTLVWEVPLATAFKGPITNRFTMPLPIPWLTISMVGVLVVMLAVGLIYYLRSRRKKNC